MFFLYYITKLNSLSMYIIQRLTCTCTLSDLCMAHYCCYALDNDASMSMGKLEDNALNCNCSNAQMNYTKAHHSINSNITDYSNEQ